MNLLIKLLGGNPATLAWVLLGVALTCGGAGGYAGWALNGWRLSGQLEECKGNLARAQDANTAFASAVERQTASILALKAAQDRREAEAKRAAEQAKALSLGMLGAADALLKKALPGDPAQDCGALEQDLNEAITGRRAQ